MRRWEPAKKRFLSRDVKAITENFYQLIRHNHLKGDTAMVFKRKYDWVRIGMEIKEDFDSLDDISEEDLSSHRAPFKRLKKTGKISK